MKGHGALVAMGAWLAGTICVSLIATENFYTIDRLLAEPSNPHFAATVARFGQPETRDVLRYLSSELNRLYFQLWNWAQVVLGALVLWLVSSRTPSANGNAKQRSRAQVGVAAMLAIVVLMIIYLTPTIVSLGRSLDFVPRNPPPAGIERFWMLHASYTMLEMIKLIIGCAVTYWIQSISKHPAPLTV
jgi:hypothetical protein